MLLAETALARDNLSNKENLERKIGRLESEVIAWIAEATTLHANVDPADQATIVALRDDLKSRLAAAVVIA